MSVVSGIMGSITQMDTSVGSQHYWETRYLTGNPSGSYFHERKHKPVRVIPKNKCSNCFHKGKLLTCSECKSILYCSRRCQKKDWKNHKKECIGLAIDNCEF